MESVTCAKPETTPLSNRLTKYTNAATATEAKPRSTIVSVAGARHKRRNQVAHFNNNAVWHSRKSECVGHLPQHEDR